MKAIVLVGGYGTRMRPLTMSIPKQLLPLVDRPILDHVLDHLSVHGIDEVILSSPYLGETFEAYLAARTASPRVVWITEREPLDTGGAIVNALEHVDGTFVVLNGDILTRLDLTAMIEFHRDRRAAGTISLIEVADARMFGLVELDADRRLRAFREKPSEPAGGLVNAGVYVLEPSVLGKWDPGRAVNVEREVFPALIGRGDPLYGFVSQTYWTDLGTPQRYLQCTFDALEGRIPGLSYVAPHVDLRASVSLRSHLGRWVVVGPGGVVAAEAEVEDSVLLAGAEVERSAKVSESVLGPSARVGTGAILEGSVLGEGSGIAPGAVADGIRLEPGETFEG